MKTGFILHLDSLAVLDELTDEQAGILFKAIRDYNLGKEPELDFAMKMAFLPFKNQFVRDSVKYDGVCERNKINGAKGGRPKKPKETEKTQVVFEKPKKADNKNDNDNKNNNNIPELNEFLDYAREKVANIDLAAVTLKYESWIESGWCTNVKGKEHKIKNWKSTLLNTLPFLPKHEIQQQRTIID